MLAPDETEKTVGTFQDDVADTLTLGPFDSSGVWALGRKATTAEDTDPELITNFAVNIASERETDLRPTETMLELSDKTSPLSGWFGKPVWYYLILVASVLFVAEWLLHQRRVLS